MRDILLDLISHTHSLGCIDLMKITGEDDQTTFDGVASNKSVVIQGKFNDAVKEFSGGVFGLPDMPTLKTIINIDEYVEDAIINVKSDKTKGLVSMNFKNKNGDFSNDYRFMAKSIVEEQLKSVKFKGVPWHIELEPSIASIMRLQQQRSANPGEDTFTFSTDDGNLIVDLGDPSSNSGKFVFATDVTETLNNPWQWPLDQVISILNLSGDKNMKISDTGAIMITVDSGLAQYTYILPAQSK